MEEKLLQRIKNKDFKPGEYLPSENELQEIYNISRTPIRKALSKLENEGYVKKKMGKGTLVISTEKVVQNLPSFSSFAEDMKNKGLRPAYELLDFKTAQIPLHIKDYLQKKSSNTINPNNPVLIIERLMYANEETMAFHKVFLFDKKCLEIAEQLETSLANGSSLYKTLNHYDIHLTGAEQYIGATIADDKLVELLQISEGEPLIKMERITYDVDNNIIEYVDGYYRADRYKYSIKMQGNI